MHLRIYWLCAPEDHNSRSPSTCSADIEDHRWWYQAQASRDSTFKNCWYSYRCETFICITNRRRKDCTFTFSWIWSAAWVAMLVKLPWSAWVLLMDLLHLIVVIMNFLKVEQTQVVIKTQSSVWSDMGIGVVHLGIINAHLSSGNMTINFRIHLHATLCLYARVQQTEPFTFNCELLKGWINQSGDQDSHLWSNMGTGVAVGWESLCS